MHTVFGYIVTIIKIKIKIMRIGVRKDSQGQS